MRPARYFSIIQLSNSRGHGAAHDRDFHFLSPLLVLKICSVQEYLALLSVISIQPAHMLRQEMEAGKMLNFRQKAFIICKK